jgi:hypothetical protein
MTLKGMDNVLIVVDDLVAAKTFFIELGLRLEGEQMVEGPLIGRLVGLKDVRATLAMMRTPDGHGINWTRSTRSTQSGWARERAGEHTGHPSDHVRSR